MTSHEATEHLEATNSSDEGSDDGGVSKWTKQEKRLLKQLQERLDEISDEEGDPPDRVDRIYSSKQREDLIVRVVGEECDLFHATVDFGELYNTKCVENLIGYGSVSDTQKAALHNMHSLSLSKPPELHILFGGLPDVDYYGPLQRDVVDALSNSKRLYCKPPVTMYKKCRNSRESVFIIGAIDARWVEGPFAASNTADYCGLNGTTRGQSETVKSLCGGTFRGTFKDGLRQGRGVFIGRDGLEVRRGVWKDGYQTHGTLRMQYESGSMEYEGEFCNGKFHGLGVLCQTRGSFVSRYHGHWKNGLPHGDTGCATLWYRDEISGKLLGTIAQYTGGWKRGVRHGACGVSVSHFTRNELVGCVGLQCFRDGGEYRLKLEGEWTRGNLDGLGKICVDARSAGSESWEAYFWYKGYLDNNMKNAEFGSSAHFFKRTTVEGVEMNMCARFEGGWYRDERCGPGNELLIDIDAQECGYQYMGEFVRGRKHGRAVTAASIEKIVSSSGTSCTIGLSRGLHRHGKLNGRGVVVTVDGWVVDGRFTDNRPDNGIVVTTDILNNTSSVSEWRDGAIVHGSVMVCPVLPGGTAFEMMVCRNVVSMFDEDNPLTLIVSQAHLKASSRPDSHSMKSSLETNQNVSGCLNVTYAGLSHAGETPYTKSNPWIKAYGRDFGYFNGRCCEEGSASIGDVDELLGNDSIKVMLPDGTLPEGPSAHVVYDGKVVFRAAFVGEPFVLHGSDKNELVVRVEYDDALRGSGDGRGEGCFGRVRHTARFKSGDVYDALRANVERREALFSEFDGEYAFAFAGADEIVSQEVSLAVDERTTVRFVVAPVGDERHAGARGSKGGRKAAARRRGRGGGNSGSSSRRRSEQLRVLGVEVEASIADAEVVVRPCDEPEVDECPVCFDPLEDPVWTCDGCKTCRMHLKCAVGWFRASMTCPKCRAPVDAASLQ